jgi:hypothetical protein
VAQEGAVTRFELQNIPLNSTVRYHGILCYKREGFIQLCLDICTFAVIKSVGPGRGPTRGRQSRLSLVGQERDSPFRGIFIDVVVEDVLGIVDGKLGSFLL